MPVLLEAREAEGDIAPFAIPHASDVLEIGLLNNLSDGGLKSGERQFIGLLEAAAGDLVVRLKLYSLPQIPRGIAARARIGALYSDLPSLMRSQLDGLIVTGAEPMAARLSEEPFWRALTEIVDWAEHNTHSTIWSCLAAHAAVLHLDGIDRRPIGKKRFGIYEVKRTGDHALLAGVGAGASPHHVPHSRFNALLESDLAAHGYQILTRSPTAGVDTFVKQWRSLFVYLQGHPEYDVAGLMREYRRDLIRYLAGESEHFPAVPDDYFSIEIEAKLRDFEMLARIERVPETIANLPIGHAADGLRPELWRQDAVTLVRNWLVYLTTVKDKSIP